MFDIITFGSATRDIIVKPKSLTVLKYDKNYTNGQEVCFPLGSKIDIEEINFTTGGGGTNTVATFAKRGFKTAFLGAIGNDLAGQEIINELKMLKINARLVLRKKEKPTNHSIVILDSNKERTILAYRGASELLGKNDIKWNKIKTKWIYLAPLSGVTCESFENIIGFANKNNIKVAVNPGMAQLSLPSFPEIAKKIDILILNQEEASFLTKTGAPKDLGARPSTNIENVSALVPWQREILRKIDNMCPGIVIMTMGGEGVVVADGKHIFYAKPSESREVVDTTGAGDAFGSGFVSGFIESNGDIEYSIQLAMANSEGCIGKIGAKNGLLKKGEDFKKVEVLKEECDNNVCLVK